MKILKIILFNLILTSNVMALQNKPNLLVEGLYLGQTEEDVISKIGNPQKKSEDINKNKVLIYSDLGVNFLLSDAENLHQIIISKKLKNDLNGINIGSEKSLIIKKFGELKFEKLFDIEVAEYKTKEWCLIFMINEEGKVKSMTIVVNRNEWPGNIKPEGNKK